MKFRLLIVIVFLFTTHCNAQGKIIQADTIILQSIEINALRATDNTPIAKTNLLKKDIEGNNIGQDLPFILNQTPSVQVNSDAGNGIGYTGLRIRGTDASRINVTLNGIPYNDAESQGAYFVDLPDIATSSSSIQIQRGVGSSTNGSGAFGGSININTNDIDPKKYIQFNNNSGSYNSFRNSLQLNSGLLKKHIVFNARISNINSDGYIDRASTQLHSFYTSIAWMNELNSFKLNVFSGKEKTYAAWFGINQATLDSNRQYNPAGTEKEGDPYSNETDNYTQTHYQFFFNRKLKEHWKSSIALFLSRGKGYYEQYKANQLLNDYTLPNYFNGIDSIYSTNLVRRLWLDNYFYGTVYSMQYNTINTNIIIGGSVNKYEGKHFGEIIDAQIQPAVPKNFKWYDLAACKNDYSLYTKWTQKINKNWSTYIDLQARIVQYSINGFEHNPTILVKNKYQFFNPKMGITYIKSNNKFYFSYAKAAKEPNRDDFETGINQTPSPEVLHDFEWGYEKKNNQSNWSINLYYMLYKNQLVLSGKVNEVYAYTRVNIKDSYRAGIELQGIKKINTRLSIKGNTTLSSNKVKDFTAFIDNYDSGIQNSIFYKSADISFSPSLIASGSIEIIPIKNIEIALMGKYISSQYLDNTSNKSRRLQSYFVQNARINYTAENKKEKKINVFLQGNNIFSKKYEANGYTFSYIYGGSFTTENYYYPMATFNIMTGIEIKL